MSTHLSPLDLMERLVSFPTVSRDTNIPLIDWVADYLAGHGIESHRHLHPSEPKQGLFAHVGPWEEGAVVLSGHTDVVPVDGQDWTTDPFTVVERDGRFYGRGTCDMKGFDALAIWALVEAHRVGVARPLQIALSYDEEVGCIGAAPLIEAMQPVVPKGSAVIVGEPSMMETVSGHKGSVAFRTHVQGFEVHSSLIDRGVSAIMHGAKLIDWCNDQNAASAAATPSETALLYDPPFSTAHVGTIRGGTAENITAKDCHFSVIVRFVPDETRAEWERRYMAKVAEVRAAMQAVRPETGIAVTISSEVPALRAEQQGEAEALVRSLTGDNGVHGVSYGTEAGHFQNAGYSAIVCGPGNIAQAHQPDEYISRAQLEAGHDFMRRLIERLRS